MVIDNNILLYLIIFLLIWVVFITVWLMDLKKRLQSQRKRYNTFFGNMDNSDYNLEYKINEYFKSSKNIEGKYDKVLDIVQNIDKGLQKNIQKVGLIRYNPFEEMGGDLCFALAILDGDDTGVVLNVIHNRTGSFTYAKPIELGKSTHTLSEEELQSIVLAKKNARNHVVRKEDKTYNNSNNNINNKGEKKDEINQNVINNNNDISINNSDTNVSRGIETVPREQGGEGRLVGGVSTRSGKRYNINNNVKDYQDNELSNYEDDNYEESNYEDDNYEESNYEENNYKENNYKENNYEESNYEESNYKGSNYKGSNYEENNYEDGNQHNIIINAYKPRRASNQNKSI